MATSQVSIDRGVKHVSPGQEYIVILLACCSHIAAKLAGWFWSMQQSPWMLLAIVDCVPAAESSNLYMAKLKAFANMLYITA